MTKKAGTQAVCQRRGSRFVAAIVGSVGPVAALAGCSGGAGAGAPAGAVAPSLPTPLATSVQASDGSWATVAMGHLDQPANTFWQLLFRPAGTARWSDRVEATATATNGGLVLASGGRSLTVAVRPSADLTYTPLISTSGSAASWSNGLISAGLAARPDALALGPGGRALALVDARGGPQVLATAGDLSAWQLTLRESALATTGPGRSCGLGTLSAVGYRGTTALVGGSCSRPGAVGVFAQSDQGWSLAGPVLPRGLSHDPVEVLALGSTRTGAYCLLAATNGSGTDLVGAWSGRNGAWSTSPPFVVADGEDVTSFGLAERSRVFVLLDGPSGRERLIVASASRYAWQELPGPPAGTATVAFGPSGQADALVPDGTQLRIWALPPGLATWAKSQLVHVAIQYGSSS